MNRPIDLRSDTVTRPTRGMLEAMARAEVGDDVLGDDPTVIRLQERVAELMGKEAACYVPSGSMANQTAIRAQCEPGDEIIAHGESHIIHYETGGPAALSGCMVRPLSGERGQFDVRDVEGAARNASIHAPASRLLVIENTQNRCGGSVWALERVERVTARARALGLRTHLDGARIWNACAATGRAPREYARNFDTVSCCFSKGLGAPVGSAVCGDRATVARVARFRKMFGGAMRQSGLLAAAALHALDHHVERLKDDHANARRLGAALARVPGLSLAYEVETNMVFVEVEPRLGSAADVCQRLKGLGVLALPNAPTRIRFVCHLDVSAEQVDRAAELVAEAVGAAAHA
ncbi:MAG: aminotransferase class I/II-fold pyridoxal phosphate-dependent enzyme [Phycisphaerae bacterium]|nr:aminotransferase class I/II-fold pyridoxal phosphate-dependent enzyme [Phycisphaerae bacterium]